MGVHAARALASLDAKCEDGRMSTQSVMSGVVPEWTFADRLRKARQTASLDQREFAQAINASSSQIASWESGRSIPRDKVAVAKRIELLTRIPASWVLGLETQNPRPGGPGEGEVWAPRGSNPQPTD